MKVIIIEDEIAACENFIFLLQQINSKIEVVKTLDSVKSAIDYFKTSNEFDLIFMDIHLGDGISFEIFEEVTISTPIIFITAYDQYAIKAFKVNSIDYLLKPINKVELENAIAKFEKNNASINDIKKIQKVLSEIKQQNKTYKTTFLVHKRESLIPIETNEIAFFNINSGIVKGTRHNKESFIMDRNMDRLIAEIDPTLFYRVNRQFIVHRTAIKKINYSFNGKLTLTVSPKFNEPIIISKAKSTHFKEWMKNY